MPAGTGGASWHCVCTLRQRTWLPMPFVGDWDIMMVHMSAVWNTDVCSFTEACWLAAGACMRWQSGSA